ncbi:MAG: protein kinase [Phycisphaerales bacterium]
MSTPPPDDTWDRLQAAMERVRRTRGAVARRRVIDLEIERAPDLAAVLEPMLAADAARGEGEHGRNGGRGDGRDAAAGDRLAAAESLLEGIRRSGGAIELPVSDVSAVSGVSTGAAAAGPHPAPASAPPSDRVPDPATIAHYRLGPVIGQGATSIVHRAHDTRPGASSDAVALKRIVGGFGPRPTRRLLDREAALLRRLDHPGIAGWIDAGVARVHGGDQPWIAMELVDGVPITRWAAARALSAPDVLRLVADVADALAHAHARGVVHRDLKSANILVDVDGRPRILDFGAARLEDPSGSDTLTRTGVVIGTVGSMAPEQFEAVPERIGPRSDIYALGVLAYRMLSGRLPFEVAGRPLVDAARIICDEEPSSLGSLDRRLRGPVAHVVGTAMARDPGARYPSAEAMAKDLRRAADGQPVVARPPSVGTQMRRLVRRHRRVAAGVALTVAGLIVVTSLAVVAAVGAERLRREEVRSRQDAEQREEAADALRRESDRLRAEAEHQSAVANVALAGSALRSGNAAEARRWLGSVAPERRGWAWDHLNGRADRSVGTPITVPPATSRDAPVAMVALGPDRLAVANRDGTVAVLDRGLSSAAPGGFAVPAGSAALAASNGSAALAKSPVPAAATAPVARPAPTSTQLWPVGVQPRGIAAGRTPDECFVFGVSGIERLDVVTGVRTTLGPAPAAGDGPTSGRRTILAARLLPTGNELITVDLAGRVRWLDPATGAVLASLESPPWSGTSGGSGAAGMAGASGSSVRSRPVDAAPIPSAGPITSTASVHPPTWPAPPIIVPDPGGNGVFVHDGGRLLLLHRDDSSLQSGASGLSSQPRQPKRFDPAAPAASADPVPNVARLPAAEVLVHEKRVPVRRFIVSPDGDHLITLVGDADLVVRSRDGRVVNQWKATRGRVVDLRAMADGTIVTLAFEGIARWKLGGTLFWREREPSGRPMALADLGGERVVSLSTDRELRAWDLRAPGSPMFISSPVPPTALAFSGDVLIAATGASVSGWHAIDGEVQWPLDAAGFAGTVQSAGATSSVAAREPGNSSNAETAGDLNVDADPSGPIRDMATIDGDLIVASDRLTRRGGTEDQRGSAPTVQWSVDLGGPVLAVAVMPSGAHAVAVTERGDIVRVAVATGEVEQRARFSAMIESPVLAGLAGGDVLVAGQAVGGTRGRVARLGASDLLPRWALDLPSHPVTRVLPLPRPWPLKPDPSAGPDPVAGRGPHPPECVAMAARAGSVVIIDAANGALVDVLLRMSERVRHIAAIPGTPADPDDWRLVVVEGDNLLHLLRPGDVEPEATLMLYEQPVTALAASADGAFIAIGRDDGEIEVLHRYPQAERRVSRRDVSHDHSAGP